MSTCARAPALAAPRGVERDPWAPPQPASQPASEPASQPASVLPDQGIDPGAASRLRFHDFACGIFCKTKSGRAPSPPPGAPGKAGRTQTGARCGKKAGPGAPKERATQIDDLTFATWNVKGFIVGASRVGPIGLANDERRRP